jgi:hypothetical protein
MPPPYVFVIYGPCKTCIAWLVTDPLLFAMGLAVALTPPTVSARRLGINPVIARDIAIVEKYWLCL